MFFNNRYFLLASPAGFEPAREEVLASQKTAIRANNWTTIQSGQSQKVLRWLLDTSTKQAKPSAMHKGD